MREPVMDANLPQVDFRVLPPAAPSLSNAVAVTEEGFGELVGALMAEAAAPVAAAAEGGQGTVRAHADIVVPHSGWTMPEPAASVAMVTPDVPTGSEPPVTCTDVPDWMPQAQMPILAAHAHGSGEPESAPPVPAPATDDSRPVAQGPAELPQRADLAVAAPEKLQSLALQPGAPVQAEARNDPAPAQNAASAPSMTAVPAGAVPGVSAVASAPFTPDVGASMPAPMPVIATAESAALPGAATTGAAEPAGTPAMAPGISAAPASALAAPPPVAPGPVVQQIVGVLESAREAVLEITLSPAELGRVSLRMQPGEGGMLVLVMAERSETLDLLRRHAADLAAELRGMGYADVSFRFGQQQGDARKSEAGSATECPAGEGDVTTGKQGVLVSLGAAAGLDLRL